MNTDSNRHASFYISVLKFAVLLALIVVILGAYTRLADAGLGCPDWPGCYGHIGVPEQVTDSAYDRPLEKGKAWKEMIHRYVAGTLGLVILLIVFLVVKKRTKVAQSKGLPVLLLLTVIFQALLGMWTVTLLLSPAIVTAHLIGGFTTLSLLWWLLLNQTSGEHIIHPHHGTNRGMKTFVLIGLFIVIVQIILGGWTSTNYAALACGPDFPTCAGQWWPKMDFANGFDVSHSSGTNYEFGILENPARTAIQVTHRIGALIVFIFLLGLSFALFKFSQGRHKDWAALLLFLLAIQITLGILNVTLGLPISVAVAHNLVAALLLLTMLGINHRVWKE